MKDEIIRLQSMALRQFKNVEYGKIMFPSAANNTNVYHQAEVLGIYGQNGSGKTAVIEAMGFLKQLLSGASVSPDITEYIMKGFQKSELSFRFYIQNQEAEYMVDYFFSICRGENNHPIIGNEKIVSSKRENDKWMSRVTLCDFNVEDKEILIKPKYRWDAIVSENRENKIDLKVTKKMVIKESRSYLFSEEFIALTKKVFGEPSDLYRVLSGLHFYSKTNLFVIKNNYSGAISLDIALPLAFKQESGHKLSIGRLAVSLVEPTVMPLPDYGIVKDIIQIQNLVIRSLIPGLELVIREYGQQAAADGRMGMRFEILSGRNGTTIPLRYESEGIKKILSSLNLLISMYNNPSMCIAIDELDAGVYEYLLGELLSIIEESGKGQLIFTSHNLRPLEMISKDDLIFTTTNPKNRFMKMMHVKKNNNLRDLYLRSINLGGQKEQIYENTNGFEISRALRKAGRKVDGKN